jgi:hypothetical protein
VDPVAGVPGLWEDWYRRAAPEQQRDLLALALRQGILYASQLPPPSSQARSAGDGTLAAPQVLLSALVNGQVSLEPLRAPEVGVDDAALDSVQRQAVARALATPDLCLIQGVPGTGKSRAIAEVVRQATRRGERVLLLAPTAPALDRVLERLGCRETLCPVRLLAADESPEMLPACVRRLTVAERLRSFQEHTLPAARAVLEEAQAVYTRRQAQQGTWARLEALAVRHEERAARLRQVQEHGAGVAAVVEAELDRAGAEGAPAGFAAEWVACLGRRDEAGKHIDAQLAVLQEEIRKREARLRQVETDLAEIGPLVEALRGRRWWTGAWWRAIFRRAQVRARCADLERDRDERRAALDKVEQERADVLAEQAEVNRLLQADRQRLIETEASRRRDAWDVEAAALAVEQDRDQQEWARLISAWEGMKDEGRGTRAEPGPPTLIPHPASLIPSSSELAAALEQDARRESNARQWAEALEQEAGKLPEYLARCANVVAATTAALAADPLFGGAAGSGFDLLVLDEAHQVTESEAVAAARRARRWVLVGEPPLGEEPWGVRREAWGEKNRTPHAPRPTPHALRPGFFQRLWQQLHAEPRRLGYAWSRRGERLVCSLRPVGPDQERRLETEPVADRPDVELRILVGPRPARRGAPPTETPRLAEVTFPAGTPLEEAKAFIFRELQELPVQAVGRGLYWVEQPERVVLELATNRPADLVAVHLDEGIREMIGRETGNTAALEFDRGAGWTLERAERWVAEHLGLRDLGRTTRLAIPYRAAPPLAQFLSDVLFDGLEGRQGDTETRRHGEAAVEFVAVPPLAQDDKGTRRQGDKGTERQGDADAGRAGGSLSPCHLVTFSPSHPTTVRPPRLRGVKGGAGLEVDLADPRPLEPLPAEVRAALPGRGLVNYLEARAVVRRLETLLADSDFQAAGLDWQRQPITPGDPAGPGGEVQANGRSGGAIHRPAVAVMALSAAQVELVRFLMSRVPGLVEGPLAVEVGLPAEFRQRECLAALVSLTRSHTHRAASYGDGPHSLIEALTRPASRLILFGDPATLARRSQWQGPLDHLDEAAARAERDVVVRLVAYLQGHGAHPQVFRLLEGSSS